MQLRSEPVKTLTFTININGASDSVLIIPDPNSDGSGNNLKDYDEGKGEGSDDIFIEFDPPIFDVDKIITDPNGGIITIPVVTEDLLLETTNFPVKDLSRTSD